MGGQNSLFMGHIVWLLSLSVWWENQTEMACFAHMLLRWVDKILVPPYDFHDMENVDGIVKSSHKNGIYYIMRNINEFEEFWMNKSKVRYGLVWIKRSILKHAWRSWFQCLLSHYMRTWTHKLHLQSCSEIHFTSISPFQLRKLSSQKLKGVHWNLSK